MSSEDISSKPENQPMTRDEAQALLDSGYMEDATNEVWEQVDSALRQPETTGDQNA